MASAGSGYPSMMPAAIVPPAIWRISSMQRRRPRSAIAGCTPRLKRSPASLLIFWLCMVRRMLMKFQAAASSRTFVVAGRWAIALP